MTATDRDPPGWVTRLRKIQGRRRDGCRRCGVRGNKAKLVDTEVGWFCRAHERQLSPLIARHDDDQDDDQ